MKQAFRSTDPISRICQMCRKYSMPITAEALGYTVLPENYFD